MCGSSIVFSYTTGRKQKEKKTKKKRASFALWAGGIARVMKPRAGEKKKKKKNKKKKKKKQKLAKAITKNFRIAVRAFYSHRPLAKNYRPRNFIA